MISFKSLEHFQLLDFQTAHRFSACTCSYLSWIYKEIFTALADLSLSIPNYANASDLLQRLGLDFAQLASIYFFLLLHIDWARVSMSGSTKPFSV
jgi:hypothetical protein